MLAAKQNKKQNATAIRITMILVQFQSISFSSSFLYFMVMCLAEVEARQIIEYTRFVIVLIINDV